MFFNILKFELKYRSKRPATYIYFAILFLLAFLGISIDEVTVGGGAGQVKDNAPTIMAMMTLILTALPGFLIISAIMGVPVLRDYQHKTDSMMFTTTIKKWEYLFGRFAGSFIVLVFVFSGITLGLLLGPLMPWVDADKMLPFNAWNSIQPFLLFAIPNLFISGAFFFMGGTLSKKVLFVFVQGGLLLVFYMVTSELMSELDNRTIAALLDPFAINTSSITSQYWTVTEQNTQLYSLSGFVLFNRLLWMGFGTLVLGITYYVFNFHSSSTTWFRKKKKVAASPSAPFDSGKIKVPVANLTDGLSTNLIRIVNLSRLYAVEIVKSIPFIAIVVFGMVMMMVNATHFNTMYGTEVYPTTYQVLGLLSGFNFFFLIIIVFYAGELIWRERDLKMDQIYDALPIPDFVGLASKFLGFVYVLIAMLFALMITGILIQTVKGYYNYEIPIYLTRLFTQTFSFLLLFTFLTFFIQVMANNKFLGHALVAVFFISTLVLDQLGVEHSMFNFASGGLGSYSDMNANGHYFFRFSWFKIYWYAFAMILFGLSVVFSIRGTNAILKTRIKLAQMRFSRPLIVFSMAALLLFSGSGCYIFYNTNVLNEYMNSDAQEELQATYEKELKKYQDIPQPRIVDTYLDLDIYPYERDFRVKGYFTLKNKTNESIEHIHIQHAAQPGMKIKEITMERMDSIGTGNAIISESHDDYKYFIYELDRPMFPGDSLKMNFTGEFITQGFVEGQSNTNVVFNGTFFNNRYFPSIGYEPSNEISDDDTRKDYDLPEKERMRERDDPIGLKMDLFGDDADHIRFEIVMSTSDDQIAIAPGYLQREWKEDDRRYFHYKMDMPMANFYSMISARYEVMREKWTAPTGQDINLEIYYHEGHEYNLDRMMEAMKHSLTYYSEHFSPYQYRQMRIMEFPRYATFAQSFANTVPFSEGIGFISDIKEDDVDMTYYVTAHEMAHQWWGHQVTEASVKGNAMLSETMSQYSALMVMKEKYPPELMQKFLKHELDRYLRGRATETKKEQPLQFVEGQGYIHYRKGSLIMYALQDYIGEDSVNAALHRYATDWAWREDRYVTTDILLNYFRDVTPDSLQHLITDMFETITLFENRTKEATYSKSGSDSYTVNLDISAIKYRADSLGNESSIGLNDWIDVGVFGETEAGKDTLLYLQKHKITQEETQIVVKVNQKPTKAGIDPINKLIDRNPEDNVKTLSEKSKEIALKD